MVQNDSKLTFWMRRVSRSEVNTVTQIVLLHFSLPDRSCLSGSRIPPPAAILKPLRGLARKRFVNSLQQPFCTQTIHSPTGLGN